MVGLPQPAWLTLAEALSCVTQATGADARVAGDALQRALRDGLVEARGRCRSYTGHETVTRLGAVAWDRSKVLWDRSAFGIPAPAPQREHVFLDVAIEASTLRRWLHWRPAEEREQPASTGPVAARRGRLPDYPWDEFWAELVCKIADDEWPALEDRKGWQTQADLERYMAEWCSRTWNKEPAESEVRKRITTLMRHRTSRGRQI
jgi:hypothetical protein